MEVHLPQFPELGHMPIQLDMRRLNEEEGIATILMHSVSGIRVTGGNLTNTRLTDTNRSGLHLKGRQNKP